MYACVRAGMLIGMSEHTSMQERRVLPLARALAQSESGASAVVAPENADLVASGPPEMHDPNFHLRPRVIAPVSLAGRVYFDPCVLNRELKRDALTYVDDERCQPSGVCKTSID